MLTGSAAVKSFMNAVHCARANRQSLLQSHATEYMLVRDHIPPIHKLFKRGRDILQPSLSVYNFSLPIGKPVRIHASNCTSK